MRIRQLPVLDTESNGSRYLTEDMRGGTADLITALLGSVPFAQSIGGHMPDLARVTDGSKVSDHHAILPTMEATRG